MKKQRKSENEVLKHLQKGHLSNKLLPRVLFMLYLVLTGFQSYSQKKIYYDSLRREITAKEFQKMSEPIKDYILSKTEKVNGEEVTSYEIPNSATLKIIYDEVAKANNAVKLIIGKPFPQRELKGMDDRRFTVKDYEGKIVVMNFWFVECGPCVKEMPELNKLKREFSSHPDVVFLAPSLSTKKAIEEFLTKRKFDYILTHDASDLNQSTLGLVSYPSHFIINKKGIVSTVITEANGNIYTTLRTKITELLKE